jgi:hypothetical protein
VAAGRIGVGVVRRRVCRAWQHDAADRRPDPLPLRRHAEARNYNLSLLFTQGPRGEYLADVDVHIMRGGKEVANFRADGPRCLIKAPPASYNIIATYEGATKRVTVQTGSTHSVQLHW